MVLCVDREVRRYKGLDHAVREYASNPGLVNGGDVFEAPWQIKFHAPSQSPISVREYECECLGSDASRSKEELKHFVSVLDGARAGPADTNDQYREGFGGFFEKIAKCARWRGKGRPGALFLRGRRRFGVPLYDFGKFWMMDFVKGFARSVYYGF